MACESRHLIPDFVKGETLIKCRKRLQNLPSRAMKYHVTHVYNILKILSQSKSSLFLLGNLRTTTTARSTTTGSEIIRKYANAAVVLLSSTTPNTALSRRR